MCIKWNTNGRSEGGMRKGEGGKEGKMKRAVGKKQRGGGNLASKLCVCVCM